MKCIKCGGIMLNDCCVNCGYMKNGNYTNKKDTFDKFEDIKNYNSSFDSMHRNKKKYLVFILGPLYLSYRNHLLSGCLMSLIDFSISCLIMAKLTQINEYSNFLFLLLLFTYIFIKRIIYVSFLNPICLRLDFYKIKILKKTKKNYIKIIKNHKSRSIFTLLLNIILYILLFLVIIIYISLYT